MNKFKVIKLPYSTFESMDFEWTLCLLNSEANTLFSSWVWQKAWWDIWQPRLNLDLLLLGVYEDTQLIGIAPCYTHKVKNSVGMKFTRCEFIGNYSVNNDSIRSEYLNFIFPKGKSEELLPSVVAFLKNQFIDELVLKDVDALSDTARLIINFFPECYKTQENGIRINTSGLFSSYLAGLSKNTRLKLFNRRKELNKPEIKVLKQADNIPELFEQLNTMHLSRWGGHCFSPHSLRFHIKIAEYFLSNDSLSALILLEDGIPKAVCYDVTIENTTYNIQLGFASSISNRISLGTLMLGYAIERSFADPLVESYDLLAGNGKNTFYKKKFNGDIQTFQTFHIPITVSLKIYYWLKQQLRNIKHVIKSSLP